VKVGTVNNNVDCEAFKQEKMIMKKAIAALAATVAHRGETQTLEHAPRTHGGATTSPAAKAEAKVEAPKVDPLSTDEKAELRKYEHVIERGIKVFVEVGEALISIRDARLYRESHPTFESYCRERWGFSKTHANRLIQGAGVAKNLAPIGVIPQNESQVRILASLPPTDQVRVFKQALKLAEGHATAVTARTVQEAAEKLGVKVPTPASTAAGNVSGSRGSADKLVARDAVVEALQEWAEDHWEKASTMSVADFVKQVKKVIRDL
jgi:hypothetical protein